MARARAAVVLLAVIIAAACAAPVGTGSPGTVAPTAAVLPTTTLVLWHGWYGDERATLGRLVEQFNRTSTQGRISLQAVPLATFAGELRRAAASGSGPHIAIVPHPWIGDLARDGVLLSLDGAFSTDELADFIPTSLAAAYATVDARRQLYGVPLTFDTLALYYNRANVLVAPEDTATLFERARGLTDRRGTAPVWGLALNLSVDTTIGYLYAFGGRVFADDGTLALGGSGRAGATRWLAWLQQLQADDGLLAPAEQSILVDRELRNGRALITFDWAHHLALYRGLWGENLGVAPLPRLSDTGQPARPYLRADVLVANRRLGGGEVRTALAFARFLSSDGAQRALLDGDMQPARGALPLEGDAPRMVIARVFRSQAAMAVPMPAYPQRALVEQELRVMQRQVLSGVMSPEQAVDEADRRLRERLSGAP